MNDSRAYNGTQAVVRALRLLKLFHGAAQFTAREIQERSKLNRTTTVRLLSALQAEGMLIRDPETQAYRLGPQVAALGRRASGSGDLSELAQSTLKRLASELHETITLEILAEDQIVIIAEAAGDHVLGVMPSLGTSWPASATSTGKVLLAALPDKECERRLRGRLRQMTEHSIANKKQLLLELGKVRQQGFAFSNEELEPGYVAVAIPVKDGSGTVVAALSLGAPKHRLPGRRLKEIVQELKLGAQQITAELGG